MREEWLNIGASVVTDWRECICGTKYHYSDKKRCDICQRAFCPDCVQPFDDIEACTGCREDKQYEKNKKLDAALRKYGRTGKPEDLREYYKLKGAM